MPRQEAGAVAAKAKSGLAWRCDPQEVDLVPYTNRTDLLLKLRVGDYDER